MVAGEWYKTFDGTVKTSYFHILEIKDEQYVFFETFDYFPLFKKVVSQGKKKATIKWWMEQLIHNAVHEVQRQGVPFLLTV